MECPWRSRQGWHFLRRNCQREYWEKKVKTKIEEVKGRGFYDEADFQKIKDLGEKQNKPLTCLRRSSYFWRASTQTAQKEKKAKALKEIYECFEEIKERRDTLIKMVKEATIVVETSRNAAEEARALLIKKIQL